MPGENHNPKIQNEDLCITAQVLCLLILFLRDCVVRALSSAGSALYALIGVDDVLAVAFGNDTEGTCICAGTAVDTVVANNIAIVLHLLYLCAFNHNAYFF